MATMLGERSLDYSTLVYILLLANVFQFIYWSIDHHKMVNKIMSRNYGELIQAEALKNPSPMSSVASEINVKEDEVLNELNGMLGGL